MIEKFIIKNEITRKRWRLFKSQKRCLAAALIFLVISFFSFSAELWSNSKPLVIKHADHYYFPVLKQYHPSIFGQADVMVTDYRTLKLDPGDLAIWPVISWDPFESNKGVDFYPSQPTKSNLFGTDDRGRDVFSRLLYGFRYSITYSILVWALSMALGIVAGGVMGFAGGWIDLVGQRLVEILNTVPVLFLLIILVSIFKPSLLLLVVLTSIFGWMSMSYYVRGEFLKNRKMDYVEAARSLGASRARIIFGYILPNSLVPVVTFSPFIIAGHIYGLTALDYLGFGLSPPTPSWGELLNQAQKYFTTAWWLAIWPSMAVFVTLVLLTLIGEGVRIAFDPKRSEV